MCREFHLDGLQILSEGMYRLNLNFSGEISNSSLFSTRGQSAREFIFLLQKRLMPPMVKL
jgi:hypothetical protein